ncbi:hypothetical protein V5O48_012808, partial [Marasmius crinis-equi]
MPPPPPPPPELQDADDSIVLSDLVRTGEASRLRRRGAIRSNHQRSASLDEVAGEGGTRFRLFCRGGGGGAEVGWTNEPFKPALFHGDQPSRQRVVVRGCGALIHLSTTTAQPNF